MIFGLNCGLNFAWILFGVLLTTLRVNVTQGVIFMDNFREALRVNRPILYGISRGQL